ncbi:hypothetical protein A2899_02905 [Candidatus Amesbacteria bacterium RIFCSPLOWO2_01_FULL_49_25]|nr:MAG: hypothetical protein A2899_02905 [Candidatus Amesbacteria bacterium RIFCSPLOWO2_01_FULL_49_25]
MKYILSAIRLITPWVLRVIWYTITVLFETYRDWWLGVPKLVRRIADYWMEKADVKSGYSEYFYYAVCVASLFTIILGWIVVSYITVWTINFLIR